MQPRIPHFIPKHLLTCLALVAGLALSVACSNGGGGNGGGLGSDVPRWTDLGVYRSEITPGDLRLTWPAVTTTVSLNAPAVNVVSTCTILPSRT